MFLVLNHFPLPSIHICNQYILDTQVSLIIVAFPTARFDSMPWAGLFPPTISVILTFSEDFSAHSLIHIFYCPSIAAYLITNPTYQMCTRFKSISISLCLQRRG